MASQNSSNPVPANQNSNDESSEQISQIPNTNSQEAQTTTVENLPRSELPSYNEALKLKKMEAKLENGGIPTTMPPSYYTSTHPNSPYPDETRIVIDPADLRAIAGATDQTLYEQEVGSECMFLSAFMIAFFFNWVGFFLSVCLLPNAAGKYGALSGLGLSIAKWVTMIRYQSWVTQMNDFQQKLFFWLFIFIGFYLFFRGLINYMSIKYRPRTSNTYTQRIRERWFGYVE